MPAAASPAPNPFAAPRPEPFAQTRVLVVDDQELMRSVTVNQLKAMGFSRIWTARNGAQGLAQARAQPVDLILSGWNMPVMNGLAFLQASQELPEARSGKTPTPRPLSAPSAVAPVAAA